MAILTRVLRLRRALPILGTFAAMLLSTSCGDTTGINRPGFGGVTLRTAFSGAIRQLPLTLDRVEVRVTAAVPDSIDEGIGATLVDVNRAFSPNSDELRLEVNVPMSSQSQTVDVQLRLLAGPTILFETFTTLELSQGRSTPSEELDWSYVGPGSSAVGLIIEPSDTTVTSGSLTPFRATAINGNEADVGPFYMNWSLGATTTGTTINAAGVLRAGQPGSVWVKGRLFNGADEDSVLVTITGRPGSITKVSGDHQSAGPNNALPEDFAVLVTTSNGAPVAGVTVNWAATVGGGSMDEDVSVTDVEGIATNRGIIGPNGGVHEFTASAAGVGSVTFRANESETGVTVRWLGNTSSTWSEPTNWVGGAVPGLLDSVVIPSAEFYPVLDTTPTIGALTLIGNARITLNAHGLLVVRNLTLTGNSYIEMTGPNDFLTVGGDALFDGGDSQGHLTSGGISIGGNLTQRSTNSPSSFHATDENVLVLYGPNPIARFESPGLGTNQSAANNMSWAGTTLTLQSNLFARGIVAAGGQVGNSITSTTGENLTAGQFFNSSQQPVTFNNVTLTIQDTTTSSLLLNNITFQNMPTNRAQLTVRLPRGSHNLQSLTFTTTPVAPNGYYLSVTDNDTADGSTLVIDVFSSTPSNPGAFLQTAGGAIVQWPGISTTPPRR